MAYQHIQVYWRHTWLHTHKSDTAGAAPCVPLPVHRHMQPEINHCAQPYRHMQPDIKTVYSQTDTYNHQHPIILVLNAVSKINVNFAINEADILADTDQLLLCVCSACHGSTIFPSGEATSLGLAPPWGHSSWAASLQHIYQPLLKLSTGQKIKVSLYLIIIRASWVCWTWLLHLSQSLYKMGKSEARHQPFFFLCFFLINCPSSPLEKQDKHGMKPFPCSRSASCNLFFFCHEGWFHT